MAILKPFLRLATCDSALRSQPRHISPRFVEQTASWGAPGSVPPNVQEATQDRIIYGNIEEQSSNNVNFNVQCLGFQ